MHVAKCTWNDFNKNIRDSDCGKGGGSIRTWLDCTVVCLFDVVGVLTAHGARERHMAPGIPERAPGTTSDSNLSSSSVVLRRPVAPFNVA